MYKLGIMGGTFNPIHNAHLILAKAALREYSLDKVMFLPNYQPPHKECDQMADAAVRYKMIQEAIAGEESFFVSDFEIKKGGLSYTVDTLKAFQEIYPDHELYFIIGGDSLRDFTAWREPQEIAKLCRLLVYARDGVDPQPRIKQLTEVLDAKIDVIHAPFVDISSSHIRQCIASGKPVDELVPQKVLDIIKTNNLYKG